jgi:hypothetical protein
MQRLEHPTTVTRRGWLAQSGINLGAAALASLLPPESRAQHASVAGRPLPRHMPRAKHVIYLCQSGGPSQMDLFDEKPLMAGLFGTELPNSVRNGQRLTTQTSKQPKIPIAPSLFSFSRFGQSGATVSELLPYTSQVVDEICFIKSMHTEAINHDPATTFLVTGSERPGRPSLGAWLSYGLGSENQNLPAFVVMTSHGSKGGQPLYARLWGSGFLPTHYQGVRFRGVGEPVLYLTNPAGISRQVRREMVKTVTELNRMKLAEIDDPEIATRITQYELAFRMQTSVPDLINIADESAHVLRLYGSEVQNQGSYTYNCLMARRLVERGVRFVQLYHRGWDHHQDLPRDLRLLARSTDQATAALLQDLKNVGLLDDTLVVWAGEFGRTMYCQGELSSENYGRDHHPRCFTAWIAGGGIRRGMTYGETDDFSYNIVRDPVHVHDLNATILHCMGLDHTQLTFKFQGRRFRLTDVAGEVIQQILA